MTGAVSRLLGALCALWMVPVGAQPSAADTAPARASVEQQVDAVRRALVSDGLQRPVRVMSHAWIDGEGRLHESAQFTSDMTVRGVRVSAYLDEQAQAQAQVDVQGAVPSPEAADPQQCQERGPSWRRPAQVQTRVASGWNGAERAMGQALLHDLAAAVRTAPNGAHWAPTEAAWRPTSRYETVLLGAAPRDTDWVLELSLGPSAPPAIEPPSASARAALTRWGVLPAQAPWAMRLALRWSDRRDPQRHHQWAGDVVVRPSAPVSDASQAMAMAREAIHRQMGQWLAELDGILACEPVMAEVDGGDPALTLWLGHSGGVKAGDRVLLMAREQVPQRWLEPGALNTLGVAQVAAVHTDRSSLQWLSGPRPTTPTGWVAVPMRVAPRL